MNISRFTVTRPVFTSMMILIVVIIGGFTLLRLNIDLMPEVNLPTLTVITTYENASPEEIEELITRPLEGVLAAITGVETLVSTSREGQSVINVSFTWGINLDSAANDIRDGFDRIRDLLPENADSPVLLKFDTSAFPIIILGVGSYLSPIELRQLIDDQVKFRIERLEGVAALTIWGGLEREIQINLLPERVEALNLSLDEIIQSLRAANVTLPAGSLQQGTTDLRIRTPGRFESIDEIRNTVVAFRGNSPIYLNQVATIDDTFGEIERLSLVEGRPGVQLLVRKQAGYNTVEVADRVIAELARIEQEFPQLSIVPVIDTGKYIRRAIDNLTSSLYYGSGFAFLVLLFFLHNLRAAILVALAIPISVIASFMLIYFAGFTINMMTLGGLALGVGMMVDNAIVVIENIVRLREEKKLDLISACIEGPQQVAGAITGGTLTTMAVFLPLIFAEGIAGELFSQMGYVISFALIGSLVTALTLAPMMASRLLKSDDDSSGTERSKIAHRVNTLLGRMEARYQRVLGFSIDHPGSVLTFFGLVLVGSMALLPLIGAEFMPPSDESEVRVTYEMRPGTRLGVVEERMLEIMAIVRNEVPELQSMVTTIGPTLLRPESTAMGEIVVALAPPQERKRGSHQVADELRAALVGYPGGDLRSRAPEDVMLQMIGGGDPVQLEIRGYDLETLQAIASRVEKAMLALPEVADVNRSAKEGVPQVLFQVDRQRAADLGVSVAQIARMLETAIGGTIVSRFSDGGTEHDIVLKLKEASKLTVDQVLDLTLMNQVGQEVVLRSVVDTVSGTGPVKIERHDQQRVITVGANLVSGVSLDQAVDTVRDVIADIPVPAGYQIMFTGEWEELRKAFRDLLLVMTLGVLLVYMIMACLYESLIDPLVVMFAVPLGVIGVNVLLLLTGTTLNIVSFIGAIIMVGVVVNNAILLVDQMNFLRREQNMALRPAVLEAGRQRLRPILMTALTTILAMIPLTVAQGEGAAIQQSLARSLTGGLVSSTFITLVIVPIIYMLFHRKEG